MMAQTMSEHCYQLNTLITALPVNNSYRSASDLSRILNRYIEILNYVNSYNPEYKSATTLYYSSITNIRDNIQLLLIAESCQEKDSAFESAKNELKTDLHALAMLIQPEQELAR